MKSEWTHLESEIKRKLPAYEDQMSVLSTLNPAASSQEVRNLERMLKVSLPSDYKESLMVHNGVSYGVRHLRDNEQTSIFQTFVYLSMIDVLKTLEDAKAYAEDQTYMDEGTPSEKNSSEGNDPGDHTDKFIKDVWWSDKWVPIARTFDDTFVCIDLDPASGGKTGQIILICRGHGHLSVLAPDFKHFFMTQTGKFLANCKPAH